MFFENFKTSDGLTLHCYVASSGTNPSKANVILVHGLGDHSQGLPYRNLSNYLGMHKISVYSFDMRGHGQSDGRRMFVNTWQDFIDDLHIFTDLVKNEEPDSPLFLIGLSLGGLLVLNYAQHHPQALTGIIAVAPAVDASGVPPLVKLIIPLLARWMPKGSINPGLDMSHISRDKTAAQAYTSDPAFQTKTTPRLASEVIKTMGETRSMASQLKLPLLILHGTEDTIVRPDGSAAFLEQVGSSDKERLTYEGAYHNLFLEPNRENIFADIVRWIENHS
jgi:alpha-beta hydrolase superfamily lysophospholipase